MNPSKHIIHSNKVSHSFSPTFHSLYIFRSLNELKWWIEIQLRNWIPNWYKITYQHIMYERITYNTTIADGNNNNNHLYRWDLYQLEMNSNSSLNFIFIFQLKVWLALFQFVSMKYCIHDFANKLSELLTIGEFYYEWYLNIEQWIEWILSIHQLRTVWIHGAKKPFAYRFILKWKQKLYSHSHFA